jgi:hypothetical protein
MMQNKLVISTKEVTKSLMKICFETYKDIQNEIDDEFKKILCLCDYLWQIMPICAGLVGTMEA